MGCAGCAGCAGCVAGVRKPSFSSSTFARVWESSLGDNIVPGKLAGNEMLYLTINASSVISSGVVGFVGLVLSGSIKLQTSLANTWVLITLT